jgi:UDP-glucose 4-epimerase
MIKCSIIGSNGYIGKHFSQFLQDSGTKVQNYDLNADSCQATKKVDICDKSQISNIDLDVDYIFFFAGLTGTHNGFDKYEDFISINEIGLLNLLDAIRNSPSNPKIIFPSTRLVYKGIDSPLTEDSEKETKSIYAVNKLACEGILHAYYTNFNIPYTIFRICVPFGSFLQKDYSYGLLGFFTKMALEKKEITIYGDGSLKRTFTHIEDICKQISSVSFKNESNGEIYNVGGTTYTLMEVAALIAKKYQADIKYIPWPKRDLLIESGHTYFDDKKIRSISNISKYKLIEPD